MGRRLVCKQWQATLAVSDHVERCAKQQKNLAFCELRHTR
jgi:hypothetical protein